jgi:hypothetical protein
MPRFCRVMWCLTATRVRIAAVQWERNHGTSVRMQRDFVGRLVRHHGLPSLVIVLGPQSCVRPCGLVRGGCNGTPTSKCRRGLHHSASHDGWELRRFIANGFPLLQHIGKLRIGLGLNGQGARLLHRGGWWCDCAQRCAVACGLSRYHDTNGRHELVAPPHGVGPFIRVHDGGARNCRGIYSNRCHWICGLVGLLDNGSLSRRIGHRGRQGERAGTIIR